jgi:hypothetical protein
MIVCKEETKQILDSGGIMYLDSEGEAVAAPETLARAGYVKPPQLAEVLERAQELLAQFGARLDRLEQSRRERRARRTAAGEPTNATAEPPAGADLRTGAQDPVAQASPQPADTVAVELSAHNAQIVDVSEGSTAEPAAVPLNGAEPNASGTETADLEVSAPQDDLTPQPGAEAPEPTKGENHAGS